MPRRKKKKRKFKGMLLLICLFLILIYILFFSPLFKIRSVNVLGNKEVEAEEIRNKFNYQNIFLATENKIKNDLLKKIPKVGDLEIKKNLIKRNIKLIIHERERIGIVCQAEEELIKDCFYIDKQGIVFEQAPQTSGSLVLLIKDYSNREYYLGKEVFEKDLINFILQARENLSLEIGLRSLDFSILSWPAKELKIMTNEGWYIVFDLERDAKSQLLSLKVALEEKIQTRENLEYVDLRIENRIYYK